MFVYALTVQDGAGFGPLGTGLTLVPMALSFLAASLCMPRLVARHGRQVISAGALIQLVGLAALAGALTAGWPHPAGWRLGLAALVLGAGQGLCMTPLFRIVLSEVPAEMAGVGSGVLTTMQQTALALGVATLGSLWLTESSAGHLGALHATVLVLTLLMAISLIVAVAARSLPD